MQIMTQPCREVEHGPACLSGRLVCLDAFRGFVMLAMITGGLGLPQVARQFPKSAVWRFLGYEFDHAVWAGCTLWDLIMPAFIFMVGVAVPFSLAARRSRCESGRRIAAHVLFRSVILILLGVLLFSDNARRTNWIFISVLCQIGLAYPFAVLLAGRGLRLQLAVIATILAGWWLLFCLWPLPAAGFDYASVGVPPDWPHLTGLAAHFDKNTNPGIAFDRWFLNLFPRETPFRYREGGGSTLNFVPSIATMALGVVAGELLRSRRPAGLQFKQLLMAGVLCLALGAAMDPAILPFGPSRAWSICPIVKRIWTPSFAVYGAGWAFLGLALFYWFVELRGHRQIVRPLVVVGMNCIAMYLLASLTGGWIVKTLRIHLGPDLFGGTYGPIAKSLAITAVLWLVAWWMYRRRVFLRL